VYAHFLNLILHYELQNLIVLRYAVTSCRRFLRKQHTLLPYERGLLQLFSRLSTAHPEKHARMFERFNKEIAAGRFELTENVLDYLDFKSWLAEKCEVVT